MSSSSVCRDFLRNVCKRGPKCRFLHSKRFSSDTEGSRLDKHNKQHEETNHSYDKNDATNVIGEKNDPKDSTSRDNALGGRSMQLKVYKPIIGITH